VTTYLWDILDNDAVWAQIDAGYIRRQRHPNGNLSILNYTEKAQFERAWTPETLACRGLIIDDWTGIVLARPFPKFFNHDEPESAGIERSGQVTVTDKMDGSLGILYHDGEDWAIATRGSFASEQAIHATKLWREKYSGWVPPKGHTAVFEIVYPSNRIVVDYGDTDDLFLLGAINIRTGKTLAPNAASMHAPDPWRGPMAHTFEFRSFSEAVSAEPRQNAEGYVIHFLDTDTRQKWKQEDYKALHKVITGWNERTIWELLKDGKTVADIAENLPDEFHAWAEEVSFDLLGTYMCLVFEIEEAYDTVLDGLPEGFSRRDFALKAKESPYAPALFALLDRNEKKLETWVWDQIRPAATKEASLANS
jgi:RNA ligase